MTYVFPVTLIILDFGASIVYAWDGDWRRCIYWLAAGVLTWCVTL
jgi:hypothetical protein